MKEFIFQIAFTAMVGLLMVFLMNRSCNARIDETLERYIPKGEILSELADCDSLKGEWLKVTFQNAERQVYFCRITTKQ